MGMVVPTYQSSVAEKDMPTVRVQNTPTQDEFGGGIGKGLQQLSAGMQIKQDADDKNAVIGAKSAMDLQLSKVLYDPKDGILHQQGQYALNSTDKFSKDYDTMIQEHSKTLNPRQQQIFQQYAMSHKDNYLMSISNHEYAQRKVFTKTNAEVGINNAKAPAILNPYDDGVFKNALDVIQTNVNVADGHMGADVVQKIIEGHVSDIRVEQLNGMLSKGDGVAAKEFFNTHKSDIDPKLYDTITSKVEAKAIGQQSRSIADEVFSKFGVKDEGSALQFTRQTYGNDNGFEKIYSAVESRYNDEKRVYNERKQQNEEKIMYSVFTAKSSDEAQEIINNAVISGEIKPSQGIYLENQIKHRAKVLAGSPTQEQKDIAKYEKNQLFNDLQLIREYKELTVGADAGTLEKQLTPQQQTKYNIAAHRYTNYLVAINKGAFNPNAKPDQSQEGAAWYDRTFREIKAAHPDASDEEVQQFLTETINKSGGN